jgi:hypothetical protein
VIKYVQNQKIGKQEKKVLGAIKLKDLNRIARQIFKRKKNFIYFHKVTLAVSKVRHLPHLPPLRYGHGGLLVFWGCHPSSTGYTRRSKTQHNMCLTSLYTNKHKKLNFIKYRICFKHNNLTYIFLDFINFT